MSEITMNDLFVAIKEMSKDLNGLTKDVGEVKESVGRLEGRVEKLETHAGNLEDRMGNLETSVDNMKKEMTNMRGDMRRIDHKLNNYNNELGDAKGPNSDFAKRIRNRLKKNVPRAGLFFVLTPRSNPIVNVKKNSPEKVNRFSNFADISNTSS